MRVTRVNLTRDGFAQDRELPRTAAAEQLTVTPMSAVLESLAGGRCLRGVHSFSPFHINAKSPAR